MIDNHSHSDEEDFFRLMKRSKLEHVDPDFENKIMDQINLISVAPEGISQNWLFSTFFLLMGIAFGFASIYLFKEHRQTYFDQIHANEISLVFQSIFASLFVIFLFPIVKFYKELSLIKKQYL